MPAYTTDPSQPVAMLIPGVPAYSAGSKNQNKPNTRMAVTTSAVSSNVVTLGVQVVEGDIPAVGSTLYVSGTTRDASGLNSTDGSRTISAVSIAAATGIGTISYAKTASDLVTAADPGTAYALVPEVAEASVPNQAYQAFAIPRTGNVTPGSKMTAVIRVKYPSAPAAIKWNLQAAANNVDGDFVDLFSDSGGDVTVAGTFSEGGSFSLEFWPNAWAFLRYKDKGSSGGTNPSVIATITI
jgi:hypothetical protein